MEKNFFQQHLAIKNINWHFFATVIVMIVIINRFEKKFVKK